VTGRGRAAWSGALLMVPGALLLGSCASSPSKPSAAPPHVTTTSASTTTTSTAATTPSSTTTTAPQVTTTAALPVVACKTSVAVATPPTPAALPPTVPAVVRTNQASYLAVYSDTAGETMMIGPKGWICRAQFGADGSGGLLITPPGETIATNSGSKTQVPSSSAAEAIEVYETGASPVQGAALACPLISVAAQAMARDLNQTCAPHPAAETTYPVSPNEVAFYDPPGVAGDGAPSGGENPANGVVLYLPSKGKDSAYLATCTLPAVQHEVCTTVLNDVVARYG
jgi:hypothetical protein